MIGSVDQLDDDLTELAEDFAEAGNLEAARKALECIQETSKGIIATEKVLNKWAQSGSKLKFKDSDHLEAMASWLVAAEEFGQATRLDDRRRLRLLESVAKAIIDSDPKVFDRDTLIGLILAIPNPQLRGQLCLEMFKKFLEGGSFSTQDQTKNAAKLLLLRRQIFDGVEKEFDGVLAEWSSNEAAVAKFTSTTTKESNSLTTLCLSLDIKDCSNLMTGFLKHSSTEQIKKLKSTFSTLKSEKFTFGSNLKLFVEKMKSIATEKIEGASFAKQLLLIPAKTTVILTIMTAAIPLLPIVSQAEGRDLKSHENLLELVVKLAEISPEKALMLKLHKSIGSVFRRDRNKMSAKLQELSIEFQAEGNQKAVDLIKESIKKL